MNLYDASRTNNNKSFKTLLKRGFKDFKMGFKGACEGGYMNLVNQYILSGITDWNIGLYGAAKGGFLDLVQFFIQKKDIFFSYGLDGAYEGNQQKIIDLLVSEGKGQGLINWNYALEGACKGGHQDLIDDLIKKGATYWSWGLYGACEGGHYALVNFLINKGADYYLILIGLCRGGHKKIIKKIMDHEINNMYYDRILWDLYYSEHYYLMMIIWNKYKHLMIHFITNDTFYKQIINQMILKIQMLPVNNDLQFLVSSL